MGVNMENNIQVFENSEFGNVRVVERDGEPWFVAADVCKALDVGNPAQALTRLDDDEKNTIILNEGIPGNPTKAIVSESGLYTLVLGSRKPEAKQFKRWVTHDVIPAVRKHGAYLTSDTAVKMMADPDFMYTLAKRFIEQKDRADQLAAELDVAKPKVEYFDALVDRNCLTNFRDTAKELGIKPGAFTEWLIANHFVYRDEKGQLRPYFEDRTDGYFELKECKSQRNGWSGVQTLVTPKGREAFRLMLSACESQLVS